MSRPNQITPTEMKDIIEGLDMLLMIAQNQNDIKKYKRLNVLRDNLNEYATEFAKQQEDHNDT